jgi:hypothetical protein
MSLLISALTGIFRNLEARVAVGVATRGTSEARDAGLTLKATKVELLHYVHTEMSLSIG